MGDCVPYAIHVTTGKPLANVMILAERFGWDAEKGISAVAGWCLLRDMGASITPMQAIDGRPTLARFLPTLDGNKAYILSVKDHWIAVHRGVVYDKAQTHPRTVVTAFFEIYL